MLNPNVKLLSELNMPDLDGQLDMIITLSDVACRYALENPKIYYDYLYRMESDYNKNNYGEENMTLSFKSTSKSGSEVFTFNYEGTYGMAFKVDGFVPYIDIDKVIDGGIFSDEKEILFPPFLNNYITGDFITSYKTYNKSFQEVVLHDDYEENVGDNSISISDEVKSSFYTELSKCKKSKEISPELKTYCSYIGLALYSKIRTMYKKYNDVYKNMYATGKTR